MEKYRLHTGWTFCLDERNEKEETAPSEGFRAVTLPHDWSTDYPFDPESDTLYFFFTMVLATGMHGSMHPFI